MANQSNRHRRRIDEERRAVGPRKMGSSVGDTTIEALRLKLIEGVEPVKQSHECLWCCRTATTRYLGRRACDRHENLLQQLAIADLSRPAAPSVNATGGVHWEGDD